MPVALLLDQEVDKDVEDGVVVEMVCIDHGDEGGVAGIKALQGGPSEQGQVDAGEGGDHAAQRHAQAQQRGCQPCQHLSKAVDKVPEKVEPRVAQIKAMRQHKVGQCQDRKSTRLNSS